MRKRGEVYLRFHNAVSDFRSSSKIDSDLGGITVKVYWHNTLLKPAEILRKYINLELNK